MRNYSVLFRLFSHDKPDKTGLLLERVGNICFTASFISFVPWYFIDHTSKLADILAFFTVAGFFGGLLMFIATGIHYYDRSKPKNNFVSSAKQVFKKTFIYIFLPALVITGLALLWAATTSGPSFLK